MKSSASGSSLQTNEGGDKKCLNSELWHACAGPLVCLPMAGSRVVYFPQGHSEQVAATTNKDVDGHIPNYPNLPPQLICQLHNVTMHADLETDEVYAQMTLQPLSPQEQKDIPLPVELGIPGRQPTNYFCKTLTASDTSTHGGFSVPRRAAEKVFPPLDFSQQPPAQELIARDLHDVEWKFRHIFRGQPKRHLLTTGWSVFVSAKRLVAGDSVLFIWNEKNELLLGIRRATRPQNVMPSSVLSSDSMHIGLLAAAAHAAATNSCFTIFYNPRASPSEFVIPLSKYIKAVYHTRVSVGMRFRMLFETEESSVRRYMGTITGISDLDPVRWPSSHWRSVKVGWDESTAGEKQPRVSLWEIEPLSTFPMYPSLFPLRLKRPWHAGASSLQGSIGDPTNSLGLHSMNFQSMGMLPWMQPGVDQLQYQAMLSSGFQNLRGADPMAHLLQFQQGLHQLQQSSSQLPVLHQQQEAIQPSVPQQILQAQQCSKDNISQLVLKQEYYKQQEASSSQQLFSQGAYQQQLQNDELQHRQNPGVRPSFSKAGIMGANSELSASHSLMTSILSPNRPEGMGNPLNMQNVNHGMETNGQLLASLSSYTPPNAYADSLSLPPYPGKDASVGLGNVNMDMQHHDLFNPNVDSSGLMLPMTISMNFPNPDTGIGSIESEVSEFQNSPELLSTGQVNLPTMDPTYVKVYKSGSCGRSLDITRFSSYDQLRQELGQMFGIEGMLEDPLRSGWQLVFVDKENDVLLLGDGPWEFRWRHTKVVADEFPGSRDADKKLEGM